MVIAIGIAAPVVLNVTSDATQLNTSDQLYEKLVNPHLKGEEDEMNQVQILSLHSYGYYFKMKIILNSRLSFLDI